MNNLTDEDGRVESAQKAGRNVAGYEVRSGHTEPRNWDEDDVQNARAFSHLAALGFSRIGTRMYSQTFVDAYRAEFIRLRLEYLRTQIEAENISTAELIELQGLAEHIQPGDVQLLEAAGVPEFPEENTKATREQLDEVINRHFPDRLDTFYSVSTGLAAVEDKDGHMWRVWPDGDIEVYRR